MFSYVCSLFHLTSKSIILDIRTYSSLDSCVTEAVHRRDTTEVHKRGKLIGSKKSNPEEKKTGSSMGLDVNIFANFTIPHTHSIQSIHTITREPNNKSSQYLMVFNE